MVLAVDWRVLFFSSFPGGGIVSLFDVTLAGDNDLEVVASSVMSYVPLQHWWRPLATQPIFPLFFSPSRERLCPDLGMI